MYVSLSQYGLILKNGYPAEEYQVITEDKYILTVFRIPYSPKLRNKADTNKPVVLVNHGIMSSSADWVLGMPDKFLGEHLVGPYFRTLSEPGIPGLTRAYPLA